MCQHLLFLRSLASAIDSARMQKPQICRGTLTQPQVTDIQDEQEETCISKFRYAISLAFSLPCQGRKLL